MDPAPKRSRLDFQVASTSTSYSSVNNFTKQIIQTGEIFRLNDDCFEAIFCWLCAEDLPAFSETCIAVKKYAPLKDVIQSIAFCGDHKPQKTWDWELQYKHNHVNDLLLYYMQSECNKHPRFLSFERMALNKMDGACIANALETVDEAVFQNCELDDFYTNILRYCDNIKRLTVKKCDIIYAEDTSWLNQRYPTLESLKIHLDASLDLSVLDEFFAQNSQIKKFAYISRLSKHPTKIDKVLCAIRHLQLEELFLTFAVACKFHDIYAQLLVISQQPQFKRLALEFGSCLVKDILIDNLNNLACLDKLYALHIRDVDFAKDLPTNIDVLTNLKELYLNHTPNTAYAAEKLAMITPNLELLVIRDSVYYTPSFADFVQPFIEFLPKLKKIVLSYDVFSGFKQRIPALNEKRQKLQGACPVHIWLPLKFPLKEQPTIVGKSLIQIRPMLDVYEHY
ncbi:uncharacterized protein LOC116339619 isoform X2 [Contarinia nasturtii]|uniref:uncharacterized protein LOC116339619 isoform X2 n=1 Tax=Contarinia nasturtii TaxID=265458 RepID=UPI0012D3BDCA|nr:uncharacterized protein LOC116339619 isoform X2 [Contarinia nasturtii]